MDTKKSIQATKEGFEKSFETGSFYNRQTQDGEHLKNIVSFLQVKPGMKILDLGTGSGYLAFFLAKQYPDCQIVGLDIVRETLKVNRVRAKQEGIGNISFVSYDGEVFPMEANSFDLVVSRYALHHFPEIKKSMREVSRVLKPGGQFFISDPRPNEEDTERFVDAYMQLKKDGHIKFYTKEEWKQIGEEAGFEFVDSFDSSIRFPKKIATVHGWEEMFKRYDPAVIAGYELETVGDEFYITEQVNNVMLRAVK